MRFWAESGGAARWRQLLEDGEQEAELIRLRRATYAGKPLGSKEFHAKIEEIRKRMKAEQSVAVRRFDDGAETTKDGYFEAF
jgi:hypothetical protein